MAAVKERKAKKGKAPSIASEVDDAGPWDAWQGERVTNMPVMSLAVESMRPHPSNRMPHESDIETLAESLRRNGQIDPILVRVIPGTPPAHQILSGETRWRAARKLGWDTIDARICNVDDQRALVIVAEANEQRKDLTVIQKATLIQQLCRPVEEGGGGLTRAAAARLFKLESASAASNLVRLLDAPPAWRKRLETPDTDRNGEVVVIHQATVREVAKWSPWPSIIETIEKGYQEEIRTGFGEFVSRQHQLDAIEEWADDGYRDTTRSRYYGFQHGGDHPCYLDLDDAGLRERLEIVDLPIGDDGKLVPCALNVEEFDKLQIAEITKRQKNGSAAKSKSKAAGGGEDEAEKLTPAEQRKRDREKRKQQDEQLKNWAREWTQRLLRKGIADQIDDTVALWLSPWLLAKAGEDWRMPIGQLLQMAARKACLPDTDVKIDSPLQQVLAAFREATHGVLTSKSSATLVQQYLARWLMWPSDEFTSDEKLVARGLPETMLSLVDRDIESIAEWLDVTREEVWKNGATDGSQEREMIAELFNRHNSEQLEDLAKELGVDLTGTKKAAMVAELLAAHKPGKPLPLPGVVAQPKRSGKKHK